MNSPRPEPLTYEHVPCPLCGPGDTALRFRIPNPTRTGVYVNSALHPIAAAHDIVRCRRCGLLFASPRLARRDGLWTYTVAEEQAYFAATRRDRASGNEAMLRTLARFSGTGRLLDAGCGDGLLLAQAAAHGWEAWGVERSRTLVDGIRRTSGTSRDAAGGPVGGPVGGLVGDVAHLPFSSGVFDAVSLINVIEHVPDPAAVIAEVARVTRPGGVVAIHTPNAGGLPARIRRARWHHYDPVEHLFYFTRRTLRLLLERHGLEVVGTLELPGASRAKRAILGLSQRLGVSLGNGLGLVARKRPVAKGG